MLNQLFPDGSTGFALCPSSVQGGDPVLIGTMPAVAVDDYSALTGGTTFCYEGVYSLTVVARSIQSPVSGLAVKAGDELFATGGSLDATTNVTTGFEINKTRGGVPFGMYFPGQTAITSGATSTTAGVRLNQQGTNELV